MDQRNHHENHQVGHLDHHQENHMGIIMNPVSIPSFVSVDIWSCLDKDKMEQWLVFTKLNIDNL